MYNVNQDLPRELKEIPQSSVGAPCPIVVAEENSLLLAYYLQENPPSTSEPCALVSFKRPYAHMFGPPNDEAFSGHPLAVRGLRPYAVFEIERSSWVHTLERMNSVHPCHRPEQFANYKHYVFAFHDCTFECIAEGFAISSRHGSPWAVLAHAQNEA